METTTQIEQPAWPWIQIYGYDTIDGQKVVDNLEKKALKKGFRVSVYMNSWKTHPAPFNGDILAFVGNEVLRNSEDLDEFIEGHFTDESHLS